MIFFKDPIGKCFRLLPFICVPLFQFYFAVCSSTDWQAQKKQFWRTCCAFVAEHTVHGHQGIVARRLPVTKVRFISEYSQKVTRLDMSGLYSCPQSHYCCGYTLFFLSWWNNNNSNNAFFHLQRWRPEDNGFIRMDGDIVGEFESNGVVRIDGDIAGEIEANGTIRIDGDIVGEIDDRGRLWRDGDSIGEIDERGQIRLDGDPWGEVFRADNPSSSYVVHRVAAVLVFWAKEFQFH